MLASLSAFWFFCSPPSPQVCLCAAAWLTEVMKMLWVGGQGAISLTDLSSQQLQQMKILQESCSQ